MIRLHEKNMETYLDNMQKYFKKVQKMDKESSRQLLIRGGVLNKNGIPKKQICNANMYTGNH